MRFTITGRNIKVTDGLKERVTKKLSKLEKYFTPDTEAKVALSVTKDDQKIEVTIPTKLGLIRAEEISGDMYSSIDLVEEDIEKQINKYKKKLIDKKQSAQSFSQLFSWKRMKKGNRMTSRSSAPRSLRKAMDPMEAPADGTSGPHFLCIQNADTDEVNVVYRRKDGCYGLIEPEL